MAQKLPTACIVIKGDKARQVAEAMDRSLKSGKAVKRLKMVSAQKPLLKEKNAH